MAFFWHKIIPPVHLAQLCVTAASPCSHCCVTLITISSSYLGSLSYLLYHTIMQAYSASGREAGRGEFHLPTTSSYPVIKYSLAFCAKGI